MARASDDIRNLAVIGHGHAGKTTLVDAIAHHLKLTSRLGNTADGTSISDTEPEEKERHQTLASHVFRIAAGKVDLEIFDTPGHPDFFKNQVARVTLYFFIGERSHSSASCNGWNDTQGVFIGDRRIMFV